MMASKLATKGRAGRIALGLLVGALMLGGGLWWVQSGNSHTALAFIPLAETNQTAGETPTGTPRFSAAEISARYTEAQHDEFMRRAIANSRKAGVEYKTGGAFGAVIVTKDGKVIADGINHVVAENDPTWHGEMHAIRQACNLLHSCKLEGCVLYTSSEPCPMCLATAYWAGLDGIVYGATVADSTRYGNFQDGFIYEQLAKPAEARAISQQSRLRPEAVEVWKEYEARQDKVNY
jgi:tRNA(Arg) A34 adenosine deaminase TadA